MATLSRRKKKANLAALFLACAACTGQKSETSLSGQPESVPSPDPSTKTSAPLVPVEAKDPCVAINAQEAWLALEGRRPELGPLLSSEYYFNSVDNKMLAVSQFKREAYGETGAYVEVLTESLMRGSRVGSPSQVIATRNDFAESALLFASLPPFWQQQIEDPQPVLTIKHHLIAEGEPGYVKFENEIVSDLSLRLEQGVELRCRSGEKCRCL